MLFRVSRFVHWLWPLLCAAGLSMAEVPKVGVIDYYGLRRVPAERVRKALGVREGDPLPSSKSDVEDRLEHVPGVFRARLEAVCCDRDQAILYVGIEERDSPHVEFRVPPHGEIVLTSDILAAYREFLDAFERAARAGRAGETLLEGHALSLDAPTRAAQERFPELARVHLDVLRQVLRDSMDPEQRAIAAYVIGYAAAKRSVIDDLQYGMEDADETVRANSMRSLGAIAALGAREPRLGLRVQPASFVEMLNSIVWSDRTRALSALVTLTERRNAGLLDQLRERALPSLAEMARWKTLSHALPAYLLLGRVAGFPDKDLHAFWAKGDRELIIREALKHAPRRRPAR